MDEREILVAAILAALGGLLAWRSARHLRAFAAVMATAARSGRAAHLWAPAVIAVLSAAALSIHGSGDGDDAWVRTVLVILFGFGATWLVAGLLQAAVETTLASHDVSVADNLRARRMHTQYRVLLRIGLIAVWAIGTIAVLASFPTLRSLGAGLLASAGLVGLVLGLAAQRTIGNFLAGLQIALAQPIRLDDAVVIDDEWGWIEEITTTFVVVKIWDERRLIVPFSRLLEQSFQNWTRTRADLIGSVLLWTDYRVPIAALRQELHRALDETDLWDGRVAVLQVVEASDRAIQLRALVSASTSPRAWDLRCFVRERLLGYLAQEHPNALPAIRAEIETAARAREQAVPPVGSSPTGEASTPETGGLPGDPRDQPPAEAMPEDP